MRQTAVPAGCQRGQSAIEFALVLPVLILLMLGGADLARGFIYGVDISAASRAGMRIGISGPSQDIGDAVRSDVDPAIPNDNTQKTWGATGFGGADDKCSAGGGATNPCGDPSGCDPASGIWTSGVLACFSTRLCKQDLTGVCKAGAGIGAWATSRPAPGQTDQGVQVRVVYRFMPLTGPIQAVTGGSIFITQDSYGLATY